MTTPVPARPTTQQDDEETDDELFGRLFPLEIAWRDRQVFLQSRGYMLRPRLRPGWEPSWRTTGKSIFRSEDSFALPVRHKLDSSPILRLTP